MSTMADKKWNVEDLNNMMLQAAETGQVEIVL